MLVHLRDGLQSVRQTACRNPKKKRTVVVVIIKTTTTSRNVITSDSEQRQRPLEMGLAGISAGSMSSHHDDDDEDNDGDDGVNEACTQNKRLWEMKLSR